MTGKTYTIYSVETYDLKETLWQSVSIENDIDFIEIELNDDNYYNERLTAEMIVKIFFDIEVEGLLIEDIKKALIDFFNNKIKLPLSENEILYTRNDAKFGGMEGSYHIVIPKYHTKNELIRPIAKKITETYKFKIDTSVYGSKWFRLPNQTGLVVYKDNYHTPKYAHIVEAGQLKDFVLQYIPENSVLIPEIIKMKNCKQDKSEIKKEIEIDVEIQPKIESKNIVVNTDYLLIKYAIERGLLNSKTTTYEDWRNVGFIIKNTLGDAGIDLFVEFSKINKPKYDPEGCKKQFECFKDTFKNPLTIKTIYKWLKDDHLEEYRQILNDIKKIKKIEENNSNKYSFDNKYTKMFNTDYFHTFKTYLERKVYFEVFVSKVLRPQPMYVYREENKDLGKDNCLYSAKLIKETFQHLKSGNLDKEGNEKCFIDEWINDSDIKVYNKLDFIPFNEGVSIKEDCTLYNLFSGYSQLIKTPFDIKLKEKILKPFKDLGLELCGGNREHFDYFYKFLAQMIQQPQNRIPIAFIIKGKQGTGKNVFLKAIGNIIGKDYFISSCKPKDFFGEYAEGFYHKLLVNMNECEGKDTFDFEGKIKSFISEDTITINPKGIRPTTINNFARLIIFSNKPNPIPIDVKTSERRYVVYQTTDHYLDKQYGTKFWKQLIAHFDKPEFIGCLYNDLINQKINDIDWKAKRPITEAYKEMCKLYVPVEALFLDHIITEIKNIGKENKYDFGDEKLGVNEDDLNDTLNDEHERNGKHMYDEYIQYCKSNGFYKGDSCQLNVSKFYNKLSELEIPVRIVKSNGYNVLRFSPNAVYKHLLSRKWILKNEDEKEDDVPIDEEGNDFDDYFNF